MGDHDAGTIPGRNFLDSMEDAWVLRFRSAFDRDGIVIGVSSVISRAAHSFRGENKFVQTRVETPPWAARTYLSPDSPLWHGPIPFAGKGFGSRKYLNTNHGRICPGGGRAGRTGFVTTFGTTGGFLFRRPANPG